METYDYTASQNLLETAPHPDLTSMTRPTNSYPTLIGVIPQTTWMKLARGGIKELMLPHRLPPPLPHGSRSGAHDASADPTHVEAHGDVGEEEVSEDMIRQ